MLGSLHAASTRLSSASSAASFSPFSSSLSMIARCGIASACWPNAGGDERRCAGCAGYKQSSKTNESAAGPPGTSESLRMRKNQEPAQSAAARCTITWYGSQTELPVMMRCTMAARWLVLTLLLLCGIAYAARKFPLTAAAIVPAARGDVEVDHDNNGNTKLKMKAEYLSPPDALTPPANVYIVWIQERGGSVGPQAQGQLKVDKNRKASFETVTSVKNFDLFVTAEQDPTVKAPTGPEILRATIQP